MSWSCNSLAILPASLCQDIGDFFPSSLGVSMLLVLTPNPADFDAEMLSSGCREGERKGSLLFMGSTLTVSTCSRIMIRSFHLFWHLFIILK
ncbi:hypothetical protein SORBI_3010G080000 [Sorghum bicolor]|uniref:Uncharacterized protein n=1 Tax=Sorghum bicolor TaxID=4558 RepID=A0A194YHY3_SORBI|nr:hypothetical protein SORBI_3010G080000 [Sorghum bicolor]